MTITLTNTTINFDNGFTQASAAGAEHLGAISVTQGLTYVSFEGFHDGGYRDRYGSLMLSLENFSSNAPTGSVRDLYLQFRWTDGNGSYGWATTDGVPFRYPVLGARILNGTIGAYNDFGASAIAIGNGHGNYNGVVNILEIDNFNCSVVYNGYGTYEAGHTFTWGGGKVENRSGFPRFVDGLRLFWSSGSLHQNGRMSLQGIRG